MKFKRIRDLREDNDLTQTDLARQLHCSQRTYSYYESGTHNLPIEILIKIADFYHVSVDYLLERTNNKEINY
ncbi:MAG: helix-turn-helix domain-containing protein [Oscillospiraceae bacterium]|nr:helix-turn-helix domain-containing protein [Oscillospiraceae bacterium]